MKVILDSQIIFYSIYVKTVFNTFKKCDVNKNNTGSYSQRCKALRTSVKVAHLRKSRSFKLADISLLCVLLLLLSAMFFKKSKYQV